MNCDIVVLGAGPAGLATAICCAEAGFEVRILDRSTFPRPSIGEAVHPGAEALFERLGVTGRVRKAKFVRHTGIWIQRKDKRELVPFGETGGKAWRGYQLWRPTFDQILLDRAKELGSEFVAPAVPSEVVRNARGVKILTSAGTFGTKIIVDGTGRNRWLARHWGLTIQPFSPPLVARYEYAEGYRSDIYDNPIFSASEDGWDWTARVHKNLYQWIGLHYTQRRQGFLATPHPFETLKKVGRSCGADVTWTLVQNSASSSHFLVGDAAAVLDPSSSHGILRALSSGILAANCIKKVFRNYQDGVAAVAGYEVWHRKWFLEDAMHMHRFVQTKQPPTLRSV
jgi:flavin-dependent dehydrogenase